MIILIDDNSVNTNEEEFVHATIEDFSTITVDLGTTEHSIDLSEHDPEVYEFITNYTQYFEAEIERLKKDYYYLEKHSKHVDKWNEHLRKLVLKVLRVIKITNPTLAKNIKERDDYMIKKPFAFNYREDTLK